MIHTAVITQCDLPESIRNRINGVIPVEVTVHIAPNGAVVRAESSRKPDGLRSYLSQRAVEAVRQWKFRPATLDREPAAAQAVVRFRFRRSGTEWN